MRLFILTFAVLIAFAGNSVFARMALAEGAIDPWAFTTVRIVSGAVTLVWLAGLRRTMAQGSIAGAVWLLIYALLFSLAYIDLAAGTGALILFAAVQITMITGGIIKGERMSAVQITGLALAAVGLYILMKPGLERPPIAEAAMMAAAGVGWGLYSLRGKGAGDALGATAGNFARGSVLITFIAAAAFLSGAEPIVSAPGIMLALASGIVTSGLGYALWYYVLRDLRAITGSVSQLSVPVIAALGGAVLLSEPITLTFVIASGVILIGIALAILPMRRG